MVILLSNILEVKPAEDGRSRCRVCGDEIIKDQPTLYMHYDNQLAAYNYWGRPGTRHRRRRAFHLDCWLDADTGVKFINNLFGQLSDERLRGMGFGVEVAAPIGTPMTTIEAGWVPQVGDIIRVRPESIGKRCHYGGGNYTESMSALEVPIQSVRHDHSHSGRTGIHRITASDIGLTHHDAVDFILVRRPGRIPRSGHEWIDTLQVGDQVRIIDISSHNEGRHFGIGDIVTVAVPVSSGRSNMRVRVNRPDGSGTWWIYNDAIEEVI